MSHRAKLLRSAMPSIKKIMANPLVSVIVANYNNARYLQECLDSILNQTLKDLEIIIHDDASTDDSGKIMTEYSKNYPEIIQTKLNPSNQGVAKTRHLAILEARGEYLTTLDSDDYYHDQRKLEKELALIFQYREQKNLDIIAFSNIMRIDQETGNKNLMGNQDTIKQGNIYLEILSRSCMIPRDFIFRKKLYFEIGGYNPGLTTHEDWDLKIRLAKKYKFYYTGYNGTAYRAHTNGLSSISFSKRSRNLYSVFYSHYTQSRTIPKSERRKVKIKFFNHMKNRDLYYLKKNFLNKAYQRLLNRLIGLKYKGLAMVNDFFNRY